VRALLALALLAVTSGGCVLSAEGEIPDVEVTRHGVSIPGVPLEARPGDPVVSVPVVFDPAEQLALDGSAYRSVTVRRVTLQNTRARGNLSFLRVLRVTVNGARARAGGAAPIQVLRYERDDTRPLTVGTTLDLPLDPPVDILPAWRDPPCILTLEVQGTLPEEAWTADVTVHLGAVVGL
jgi:hypothetical protein